MSASFPVLSAAIWVPVLFGLLILCVGNDRNAPMVRKLSLFGAVISFLVTLPLFTGFERGSSAIQFAENVPWITRFGASYSLGVDGLSV